MHIALMVSLGMVAAAPFLGRWSANRWLRKQVPRRREIAGSQSPELSVFHNSDIRRSGTAVTLVERPHSKPTS